MSVPLASPTIISSAFATPFGATGNYILKENSMLILSYRCHDAVVRGENLTQVALAQDCQNIKISLGFASRIFINEFCKNIFIDIVGQSAEEILKSPDQWILKGNCTNVTLNGKKVV